MSTYLSRMLISFRLRGRPKKLCHLQVLRSNIFKYDSCMLLLVMTELELAMPSLRMIFSTPSAYNLESLEYRGTLCDHLLEEYCRCLPVSAGVNNYLQRPEQPPYTIGPSTPMQLSIQLGRSHCKHHLHNCTRE